MNILDHIIEDIKAELPLRKKIRPASELRNQEMFSLGRRSVAQALNNASTGIIAEHKRRSPSKKEISQAHRVQDVARYYQDGGASAMSVLTNQKHFGGSLEDLMLARAASDLPLLRKEFIIDPYQVIEARAFGADAILLIAAVLSTDALKELHAAAREMELEVLLEVHNAEELEKALEINCEMIGVNNRNLKTFELSLENSMALAAAIPDGVVKISESGISNPEAVNTLKSVGFRGFLIGEHFMRASDPQAELSHFINSTNHA